LTSPAVANGGILRRSSTKAGWLRRSAMEEIRDGSEKTPLNLLRAWSRSATARTNIAHNRASITRTTGWLITQTGSQG
jgi:hypothetical protein